jgi:hypothetical protein
LRGGLASGPTTVVMGASRRADYLCAGTLALLVLVVYSPALWTGFSGDDFMILARLEESRGLAGWRDYFSRGFFGYYRPLAFLSHAIDWHIWGARPAGFHLTSIVLHAANSVCVFVLGRRLMPRSPAFIAALLFAVHPASQETVYWMAARFDLLAILLTITALLLLVSPMPTRRAGGLLFFLAGLLTKESALALPVLVVAYDVLVDERDVRQIVKRLLLLAPPVFVYVLLRSLASDIPAPADSRGTGKLLVLAAVTVGLTLFAHWRVQLRSSWLGLQRRGAILIAGLLTTAAVAGLLWTPASAWVAQKAGFLAYAAFYLLSPVARPQPDQRFFAPATVFEAFPGLVVALLLLWAAWSARHWLLRRPAASWFAAFVLVSLAPVLSLTGSPRYVYMATVGLTLLVGASTMELSARSGTRMIAALALFGVISLQQLAAAASAWRWSSTMVSDGLARMLPTLHPCGTRDLILMTAPVGIRGVYSNFYWDAFKVAGCAPREIVVFLRIVRRDARVEIREVDSARFELRFKDYAGNAVASADSRNFDLPVTPGAVLNVATGAGRVETFPDGTDQVFRIQLTKEAARASLFYYSDARVRAVR